jgi:N-acetylglutamate synthase-like GNAT family acetyltransferase
VSTVDFRPVTPAHFAEARALLEAAALPTEDLEPERVWLLGAFTGERLVGTIGLEGALVRSMVVAPEHRGHGLAHQLYERLVEEARRRGLTTLFTLTQTAEAFFTGLGYVRVDRASVPTQVKATAQFSGLCPSSTAVFKSEELNRRPRPPAGG